MSEETFPRAGQAVTAEELNRRAEPFPILQPKTQEQTPQPGPYILPGRNRTVRVGPCFIGGWIGFLRRGQMLVENHETHLAKIVPVSNDETDLQIALRASLV